MKPRNQPFPARIAGLGSLPVHISVRVEARNRSDQRTVEVQVPLKDNYFVVPDGAGLGKLAVRSRRQAGGVTAFALTCDAQMIQDWVLYEVALQVEIPWRDWRTIIPSRWGVEIEDFPLDFEYVGTYPGWGACAQMMVLQANTGGLSLSARDPAMEVKYLRAKRSKRPDRMVLEIGRIPQSDGKANSEGRTAWHVSGPCEILLHTYSGDWDVAAIAYRQQQEQVRPELKRTHRLHRLLADDPFWVTYDCFCYPKHTRHHALDAIKSLAGPVLFHVYNWTPYPFDTRYPDLLADRRGLREDLAALRRAGAAAIPYLNGRVWDTTVESYKGPGKAMAVRNYRGEIETEIYSYSSNIDLAVTCPEFDGYHQRVIRSCRGVVQRHKLPGIYLDQVGAAFGLRCYEPSHNHPLGGAVSWNAGQLAMMQELRKALRADVGTAPLLTTENATEPLVHLFDGFLGFCGVHEKHGRPVPLWHAIYGDFGQAFADNFRQEWRDDKSGGPSDFMLRTLARQAIFGTSLGWISPTMLLGKFAPAADLMRNARAARLPHMRFIRRGHLIPSALDSTGQREGVLMNAWNARDGAIALAVNPTAGAVSFKWPDGKTGELAPYASMERGL